VTQKLLIDHLRLGEISDLGRASIINHRRQKIILHHGAEQRVGAEGLRLRRNPLDNFFPAEGFPAERKFPVSGGNHLALAVFHREKQRAL